MIIEKDPKQLLLHQLKALYSYDAEGEEINKVYYATLSKLDFCFSHVNNKYYRNNNQTYFNPLHIGQWTMFLYQMSHEMSKFGRTDICDMIYGLSKMFSSADIFYGVEMPRIWFFDHPQGSVMGRARYSDFFTFSQGCTVGNNKGKYPKFKKHVSMFSNSKVLGDCEIGDHVILAANSYILDESIPSFSIVFGQTPNLTIKSITAEKFNELTGAMFDCVD